MQQIITGFQFLVLLNPVAAKRTGYPNCEKANCFTLFNNRHSRRISHVTGTDAPFEVQKKQFGTHMTLFLHGTLGIWSLQVHFIVYGHNTQTLSHLNVSSYGIGFHRQPRIPLNFQ